MSTEGMLDRDKKVWLNEISFMRPCLLVLLVLYHVFAPYVGTWEKPDGIGDVELYRWIGLLSKAFRLEGFVFISGYIFTFQFIERHKYPKLSLLLKSKIKRLLITSFFFSILYLLIFNYYDSPFDFVRKVIQGAGHLWYLPCLFWCFVIQYLVLRKDNPGIIVPVLIVILLISIIPLPLNLHKPLYYALFFYGGGYFWKHSQKIKTFATWKTVTLCWILFGVLFIVLNSITIRISGYYNQITNLLLRGCVLEFKNISKAILGWAGIVALYLSASLYCQKHRISDFAIIVGACGYGVYIFHQFVLKYIYNCTDAPILWGSYYLPWVACIITIVVSLSLTLLIRKTKVGRTFL